MFREEALVELELSAVAFITKMGSSSELLGGRTCPSFGKIYQDVRQHI